MTDKINNSSQELKCQDILDEKETTEREWHLPDDFKIIDPDPFDYDTVYYGLPAYDYNTGKRLK